MRTTHKPYQTFCAAFGMLLLILDCKTALLGAREGVSLCLESVIPSLFPMIFVSVYLNSRLVNLNLKFLSPVAKLVGIPPGFEGVLLISCLGGYPVGAQTVSQAYQNNTIDKDTAERLLTFCNNAGPSFIFGVTSFLFQRKLYVWVLWFIHILSAYITGLLLSGSITCRHIKTHTEPPQTAAYALKSAIGILSTICAWVILFRVIINIIDRWILWICPDWLHIVIAGVLELTNGCLKLPLIESESLRFILCSMLLGAGGLCVFMQTVSVISPLKPKTYIIGKILQTSVSTLLAFAFLLLTDPSDMLHINPFIMLIPCALIIIVIFMHKKTVAKSGSMLYTVLNR